MGLDGISINQLGAIPERNSAELNSLAGMGLNENRIVDGLSSGQRVNPDKEHEHNSNSQKSKKQDNKEENDDNDEQITEEAITKYDLSDTNKFDIKLDDKTNKITIMEKISGNIVQIIDTDELLKFVQYSPNPYGSIVNKKL